MTKHKGASKAAKKAFNRTSGSARAKSAAAGRAAMRTKKKK